MIEQPYPQAHTLRVRKNSLHYFRGPRVFVTIQISYRGEHCHKSTRPRYVPFSAGFFPHWPAHLHAPLLPSPRMAGSLRGAGMAHPSFYAREEYFPSFLAVHVVKQKKQLSTFFGAAYGRRTVSTCWNRRRRTEETCLFTLEGKKERRKKWKPDLSSIANSY